MASALDQRQRREALGMDAAGRGREPGRKADAFSERKELEAMEEGNDISAEAAARLQNRLGNQTLNNMMNKSAAPESAGVEVEQEQEEEQEVEEEGVDKEDEGVEAEETQRQFGGSGGAGGGGGAGANPWDQANLFGGDDDGDAGDGKPRRRRLRPSAIRNFPGMGAQDLLGPRPPGALEEEDLSGIDLTLGAIPPVNEEDRWGEAAFQAVEAALLDPRRIGKRTAIEPEDLVDQTGPLDPLGRPAEIGRFLAEQGDGLLSRGLARVLGGPSAALLPAAGGHAGAVARLATLAVCAEALEGGGVATDRAVALALRWDAWHETLHAAQEAGGSGALRAPDLLAAVLGPTATDEDPPEAPAPGLSPLGGRALFRILPEGPIPSVPGIDLSPPALIEDDEEVAAIDAAIARMTGGPDVSDLPPDPNIAAATIAPALEAATGLVSAMGRAQVELAAAALAVRRVHPRAAVQPVLAQADATLRQMARTVIGAGRRLERLIGVPIQRAAERTEEAITDLRGAAEALGALRVWALSALGGAVSP